MSKYIFYWVKKKDLFWVFLDIEGDTWQMTMETGLKRREEVIEMSTTDAFHIRDAHALSSLINTYPFRKIW